MKQEYHSNAVTNIHIRTLISESKQSNSDLSEQYGVSVATISKWKNREHLHDRSSRPHTIQYSLNDVEQALAVSIRKTTWLPLDEVWECLLESNDSITRSAIYRLFCRNDINKVPTEQKEKAKKFKEYEPGYIHMDVTYLPKFDGVKHYLFVAIDRATRAMFFKVYDAKTSANTEDFMNLCLEYFPFYITHVLTDNGLEFTNRLIKSKKGVFCTKLSKLDEVCVTHNIDHRHTKPNHPQTNGMVERVNGTIKNATILREEYKGLNHMVQSLNAYLRHYMLYRRHGGVRKELGVKTPFNAIEKWYQLKPTIFNQKPVDFKNKFLNETIDIK